MTLPVQFLSCIRMWTTNRTLSHYKPSCNVLRSIKKVLESCGNFSVNPKKYEFCFLVFLHIWCTQRREMETVATERGSQPKERLLRNGGGKTKKFSMTSNISKVSRPPDSQELLFCFCLMLWYLQQRAIYVPTCMYVPTPLPIRMYVSLFV